MTQNILVEKILAVLRNEGFDREARMLNRAVDEFNTGSQITKRDAAGKINALCSVKGLSDLNIKSMEYFEWEKLLIKLDEKVKKKSMQLGLYPAQKPSKRR